METRLRSAATAVAWRVGGLAITFLAVWVATGKPILAVFIGVLDMLIKLAADYVQEYRRRKGRTNKQPPLEYQI